MPRTTIRRSCKSGGQTTHSNELYSYKFCSKDAVPHCILAAVQQKYFMQIKLLYRSQSQRKRSYLYNTLSETLGLSVGC